MVEKSNPKKYDHAEAIRQQIKHVNRLISEADMEDNQSFQMYFNKAFMALSSLQAMIQPFANEDELETRLREENPAKLNRSQKLTLIQSTLEQIYEFLYEKQLFYAHYSEEQLGSKDKEGSDSI